MSLNQSVSNYDNGLFTASWLAATTSGSQALAKIYRDFDVEKVNVIQICDKLTTATKAAKERGHDLDELHSGSVRNDAEIPFRVLTNLQLGTLKIYQQQVNNLYRQSQDLVVRSCSYDADLLKGNKRKANEISSNSKRRRITLSETYENNVGSTNYTQLLDELEKMTQDVNYGDDTEDLFVSTSTPIKLGKRKKSSTTIQIREITIREVSTTTTYGLDELDFDEGFGDATYEDITEFFNLVGEDPVTPVPTQSGVKRKSTSDDATGPAKNIRLDNNEDTNEIRSASMSLLPNETLNVPQNEISRDIQTSPHLFEDISSEMDNSLFVENNFNNPDKSITLNPPEITLNENNISRANKTMDAVVVLDEIKEEIKEEIDENNNNPNQQLGSGKRKRKSCLIIDKCIKLEDDVIMDQIEQIIKPKKMRKESLRITLKRNKFKKGNSAIKLLKKFNRRSFKVISSLKRKLSLSTEEFKKQYLSLTNMIFNDSIYKEEWAKEIYPKAFQDSANNDKRKTDTTARSSKKNCYETNIANLNIPAEHLNISTYENCLATVENRNNQQHDCFNIVKTEMNEETNFCINIEWRPYGIMQKLLAIWNYDNTNDDIDAKEFCSMAENAINAALAFSSLLVLIKHKFIRITKCPLSIEMDKILMGEKLNVILNQKL